MYIVHVNVRLGPMIINSPTSTEFFLKLFKIVFEFLCMVPPLEAVIKKDCFIVVCVFTSTIHVHVYRCIHIDIYMYIVVHIVHIPFYLSVKL